MLNSATALKNIETIAIGGFDGMHIGHQHLFEAMGDKGLVLVIETGFANLTPGREREHFTHHPIVYYPLDDIRNLDAEGFIAKLGNEFPSLSKIIVGYDFHFGKDRLYSHDDLKRIFAGDVVVIDEVKVDNDSVHSHKIRAKLQIGDIEGANRFLGHNYTIRGNVVSGQGLGKTALFPTVNMETDGFLLPQEGVYATFARLDDEEHYHPAVSFIGHRISTDGSFAVETHVLDKDVVCREKIAVSFVDFIRENRRYDSMEALKSAIESDIAAAKQILVHLSL
jgi:riboflavin kinase/FMN adenylyltransferase